MADTQTPKKPVKETPNKPKEESKSVQKKKSGFVKPVFDPNVSLKEIGHGKSHEAFMRMKLLTLLAEETQEIAPNLSWHYIAEMNQVAEKMVVRIGRGAKKFMCKTCKGYLRNKSNESIKIKRICKQKYFERSCEHCGHKKKIFLAAKTKPSKENDQTLS